MPRTYPVDRLSYSAVKEYLSNPWRFHRIYIQKINTFTDSPATLVGRAFHKCLELYYSSPDYRTPEGIARAKEAGLSIIRAAAPQVDWGKTGSLEKSEADALQTIDHYFAEDQKYEERGTLTTERILHGRIKGFPVSIKAVSDLIIEGEKMIEIVDFKKVSQLTEEGEPLPAGYVIQAWFNYKAFLASTGKKATAMIFHEIKTSKNKEEGVSQMCRRVVSFTSEEWKATDKIITKLVKEMLRDISRRNRVWLPNVSDMMAGQDSWDEWMQTMRPPQVVQTPEAVANAIPVAPVEASS